MVVKDQKNEFYLTFLWGFFKDIPVGIGKDLHARLDVPICLGFSAVYAAQWKFTESMAYWRKKRALKAKHRKMTKKQ